MERTEAKVNAAIEACRDLITEEEFDTALQYSVRHGEYGLAIETLADFIGERETRPTAAQLQLIEEAFAMMSLDSGNRLEFLRELSDGRTFRSYRSLPYSPDLVFAVFSDPEFLAHWWGPDGFTNTFEIFEFEPGGRWKFVMHGPNNTHHPNESVFAEIDAPYRLVIDHVSPPRYRLEIALTDQDGATAITWKQKFEDPAVADRIRHIVEPANEQNLDRLAALLAQL